MINLRRLASDHFLGIDPFGELFVGEKAKGKGCLSQSDIFLMGFFGDFGGVFVADALVEGGDQHQ